MTPERWRRIEDLFAAAQSLNAAEVDSFLRVQCGGDRELESEIGSLLRHHQSNNPVLTPEGPRSGVLGELAGTSTLAAGATVGPYAIVRLLGVGGMGEVYLAKDSRLRRQVALKLLAGWINADEQFVKRFTQEALAVSALNHPNVPVVYEAGEIDGRRFIASEFIDGQTLNRLIAQGRLPWHDAVPIVLQVAHALEAAHAIGVLHRDVKPGNILVCGDGRAKLVDFGIAKVLEGAACHAASDELTTATGMVIGTPRYMAPEQAAGHPVDPRSDLWSLAAVLLEMVTGQSPARGLARIRAGANLPAPLAQVIERALQSDPARRYPTAREFAIAMRRAQRWWLFGAHPMVWSLLLFVCLAAIVASGVLWRHHLVPPAQAGARRVIAVLPFDNLTADPGNEYFSQGIQDEVLTHLARISGLRVLSRHASAAFSSHPSDLESVTNKLHVGTLLEGSVQRRGDHVRVNVHLIETAGNTDLWAESYDREIKDVFEVERDIAERVAVQLQASLLPEERKSVETADTQNTEAHTAELLGRFYLARRDEQSLQKAIDHFHEAIQLDPAYALAYADLSTASYDLANLIPEKDSAGMKAQARSAAQAAVIRAPGLAEGHAALGWVMLYLDWNIAGAEREFAIAVQLSPNSSRARNGLGTLYGITGEFDRAIALFNEARALDPLSSGFANNMANVSLGRGDFDTAERMSRDALKLEPKAPLSHSNLAVIALARGSNEAATLEAEQEPDPELKDFALTLIRQAGPDPTAADDALRAFSARRGEDSPFLVASIHAFRGDANQTFQWLDRALEARDLGTIDFLERPFFQRFRSDPRYESFCAKLGVHPPATT